MYPYRVVFFSLVLFSIFSCGSSDPVKTDDKASLTGNWLILYPDHKLRNQAERTIYGKYQDSLVNLFGLKLLTLHSDGSFSESDSVKKTGVWKISEDSTVEIRNGGKGLQNFLAKFESLENDTLRLTEYILLDGRQIRVEWHLKKINEENKAARLFDMQKQQWKIKPIAAETDEQIRKRLSDMLRYYSDYFTLVNEESAYFSQLRVPIPFKYYQHDVKINPERASELQPYFYDEAQAGKAYNFLSKAMDEMGDKFPRATNFVREYALYMKELAHYVTHPKIVKTPGRN